MLRLSCYTYDDVHDLLLPKVPYVLLSFDTECDQVKPISIDCSLKKTYTTHFGLRVV